MRRGIAILLMAVGALALAYLAAVEAAVARAPATPLENGLADRGIDVHRAPASALPDLRTAPTPFALVVLVHPPPLPDAERDALRAHVESGGALWILSPDPHGRALWSDDALQATAFPGFIFGMNGSAPRLTLPEGDTVDAIGFQALELKGDAWTPLLTADARAFRDTNGNRRLDAGEPGGPFVLAAQADVGEGRITIMGGETPDLVPQTLALAFSRTLRDGDALVVDATRGDAWAGPGRGVLALAALPAGSLVAAGLVVLAAAGLLLLALAKPEEEDAAGEGASGRLVADYLARLRERNRPEDTRLIQIIEGDTAS